MVHDLDLILVCTHFRTGQVMPSAGTCCCCTAASGEGGGSDIWGTIKCHPPLSNHIEREMARQCYQCFQHQGLKMCTENVWLQRDPRWWYSFCCSSIMLEQMPARFCSICYPRDLGKKRANKFLKTPSTPVKVAHFSRAGRRHSLHVALLLEVRSNETDFLFWNFYQWYHNQ